LATIGSVSAHLKAAWKSGELLITAITRTWGRCSDDSFQRFFAIFRRKIWRFFLKTNFMIIFCIKLAAFLVKNAIFWLFFKENIFLNHNIGF
jgi:hypothetical protein